MECRNLVAWPRSTASSSYSGTRASKLGATGWHLVDQGRIDRFAEVTGVSHVVNAGFDRVRFRAPVPVGPRLRGSAVLLGSRRMRAGTRVAVRVTAEVEGESKPACVADQILVFQAGPS